MKKGFSIGYWSLFMALSVVLIPGCQKEEKSEPGALDLREPWEVSSTSEIGVDEMAIDKTISKADTLPRFSSLLVVKDGKLILEQYFHGNHQDSLNDVRSITKSVIATLAGIALENGFINSLEETIGDYLHPAIAAIPANKQKITIRNLLTMSSGLEWDEFNGDSYNQWILSGEHIDYLFDLPMVTEPGASFTYNSGVAHLLGVILEVATGMELEAFADQYLFSKIGIRRAKWENLPGGYVNGGSGIDLRPRDLARLGQFYLQEGQNGKEQILSREWIKAVTTPAFNMPWTYGVLQSVSYGRLWWIEDDPAAAAFFAWGHGGQFIYVVPSLDLVVVTTTNWRQLSLEGGPRSLTEAVLSIISEMVAAVN